MDPAGKACCNEKVAFFSSLPLSLLSFRSASKPAESKCRGLHHNKLET